MRVTLAFAALVVAVVAEDCVYSEWGDWTEWTRPDCGEDPIDAAAPSLGKHQHHLVDDHPFSARQEGRVVCNSGMAGAYPCYNIDQMSRFDLTDLCGGADCGHQNQLVGKDVWGWRYEIDAQNHVDYAIMTTNFGTAFVKMTGDAELINANMLAWLEGTNGVEAGQRDVVVVGDYAYISANSTDHGIQILNLNVLTTIQAPYYPDASLTILTPTATYMGVRMATNLVTSPLDNVLYAAGAYGNIISCNGGLLAMDITDPENPNALGCFSNQGVINDAHCKAYDGRDGDYTVNGTTSEICFAFNGIAMVVIDADDKANMQLISATSYQGRAFAAQGAVDNRDLILASGDTQDEFSNTNDKRTRTYIWDLTDLDAPFRETTYTAEHQAIDGNQYVMNDWLYQANYEAGIRILEINQLTSGLTELGFFDTFPGDSPDGIVQFAGATSVYPGFVNARDNGVLLASTIEDGLFLLRADATGMKRMIEENRQLSERYRYRTLLSAESGHSCHRTVDAETRTVPKHCTA